MENKKEPSLKRSATHRDAGAERRATFQGILEEAAPLIARRLEAKARTASWLAKIQPNDESVLYDVKHAALRQLFRVPRHAPIVRDAWTTSRGFLLSLRLHETGALLHLPFNELDSKIQQTQGGWIARRARGRTWQARRGAHTALPTCGRHYTP